MRNWVSRLSIRTIVLSMLLLFGMLAIAITLYSNNVYHALVFENKQRFTIELVHQESLDLIEDLHGKVESMAVSLPRNEEFKQAYDRGDAEVLKNILYNQFFQYFVTANVLDLRQVILYDKQLTPMLGVQRDSFDTIKYTSDTFCPDFIEQAKKRKGALRSKVYAHLCSADGLPYYSLLVPIGGLIPKGFILVMVNPVLNLKQIEKSFGLPVRITQLDNKTLYQSPHWNRLSQDNSVITQYQLRTGEEVPILHIYASEDLSTFMEDVALREQDVLWKVILMIGSSLILFIVILHMTLLRPLDSIMRYMQSVQKGQADFEGKITLCGANEMVQLGHCFNEMGSTISEQQNYLERKAAIDSLTRLPNRDFYYNTVSTILTKCSPDEESQVALLMMDLNRFKQVNDHHGHEVGDALLQEVANRLISLIPMIKPKDLRGLVDRESFDNDQLLLARLGGDEFTVMMPCLQDRKDAIVLAKQIVQAMHQPFSHKKLSIEIGISIGIAYGPEHGVGRRALMHHADIAMYHAKREGGGVIVYQQEFGE